MLQSILHRVLLIAKVKISRYCSTINFIQDYFRQQYRKRSNDKEAVTNGKVADLLPVSAESSTNFRRFSSAFCTDSKTVDLEPGQLG